MNNEKYIDKKSYNTKDEILKRIDKHSLKSKVKFCYDEIEYTDWMYLLIRVRSIINEINTLIVPHNELLTKEALENLFMMVQIINIRINPENKINTRTILSPKLFSDLIFEFVDSGYKFNTEIQNF